MGSGPCAAIVGFSRRGALNPSPSGEGDSKKLVQGVSSLLLDSLQSLIQAIRLLRFGPPVEDKGRLSWYTLMEVLGIATMIVLELRCFAETDLPPYLLIHMR